MTDIVKIVLTHEELAIVIEALGGLPLKVAYKVFTSIRNQAEVQTKVDDISPSSAETNTEKTE